MHIKKKKMKIAREHKRAFSFDAFNANAYKFTNAFSHRQQKLYVILVTHIIRCDMQRERGKRRLKWKKKKIINNFIRGILLLWFHEFGLHFMCMSSPFICGT